jgi:solute carrier family 25 protein 44
MWAQVIEVQAGQAPPTWLGTLRQLLAQEGPRGLLRGVAPRMASSAAWGTAMVSTYEFLKRLCKLPEPAAA